MRRRVGSCDDVGQRVVHADSGQSVVNSGEIHEAGSHFQIDWQSPGVGDFQRNVGNYSSALDGVKQGFSSVLELASPTGLAIAAAGLAIEGIGALAEVIQETNQQLKETAQLTGLNGQALDDYTAKVRATANVFDQEYKEVLKAANAVSKEFGISGAEAIDLIMKLDIITII